MGGPGSSIFLFFSSHCQTLPHFSGSKLNQPHNKSLLSILNLPEVSYGCNFKVQVTYLGEYGCSRMGILPHSPLLLFLFWFYALDL
ncbi:hypothetical protein RchiOBHm_Chr6g0251851 [Rosa chinensis]|uniref:Uncharacterized protein n=1 Tax=Rosa chinensis TaxID=74649 RepID=A0A2P6PKW7_ROSCH|nr:hypothetical protein RchiOBHm_Chr6g0251851 [Rosa chinensis]